MGCLASNCIKASLIQSGEPRDEIQRARSPFLYLKSGAWRRWAKPGKGSLRTQVYAGGGGPMQPCKVWSDFNEANQFGG